MMEQQEKAIIAGVNLNQQEDFAYSMEELGNLARACAIEVVGEVTQNKHRPDNSHYMGTGKLEEIRTLLEQTGADMVIFDDELTPSQVRNLEAKLECRVIDRTTLILDIFAQRAQTKEAQLQVEVARLQFMLPRLVGLRDYLSRQGGGGGRSGLTNRGAGELKLELDRRKISERITALNKELEKVAAGRQIQSKQRKQKQIPVVSLVGYTNAGKSSLMNAIVQRFQQTGTKQVFEKNMLFATLDTSVRHIKLTDNKSFLLTDTVGFINKLPHQLIKAFRSTLEEATQGDVLIHVVDYSHPHYEQLRHVTQETLREIGADDIPVIYAYNKSDLTDLDIPDAGDDYVYLSAKQEVGIDELIQLIRQQVFTDYVHCELLVPYDQGQIVSYFNENAHVLGTSYEPNGTKLMLEAKKSDVQRYQHYVIGETS